MFELGRLRQRFPSRQYAYSAPGAFAAPLPPLAPGQSYRFILGRDAQPSAIAPEEGRRLLKDPFAQAVLFAGTPVPLSLSALVAHLDSLNGDATNALPTQSSFVVADGGQIPWTPETDDLQRGFRFAISRSRAGAGQPDLLISTSTQIDSETDEAFLQVIGWDPEAGAFQFYERRHRVWIWAGSSWDALAPDSRGRGPFDSHVNGALNMKELKQPWVNWNSQSARILDSALAPDDPLRTEPVWTSRSGAENFETEVVRPGILRWNTSRFQKLSKDGRLTRFPEFLRQVLETTTVNLISSPTSSARLASAQTIPLPLTFFINSDALLNVIGLEPDISPPQVAGAIYRAMLEQFDVALTDGQHRIPGDTNFVFVVPEPAFEDTLVTETLISKAVVSRRLAAALLMVDFCNPVFSARRAGLVRYAPESASTEDHTDFERAFLHAVQQSPQTSAPGSPEQEFLRNAALGDNEWQKTYEERIETFFAALAPSLTQKDRFAEIFQLAESRRREFRKRPLAEFRLTIPTTNIPETAPLLEFTTEAQIRPKA